jgi:hypothetical protein
MTAALVFSSCFASPSPSLFLSLFHILNIASAKPAREFKDEQQHKQQDRQCLWCGQSGGEITPNGFHPKCLEQFLALPEPCRTCALIWIDLFPGPPSTICLLWMDFPKEPCDAHTPWWEA